MNKISVDEALDKDIDTAVDFEITLAALLSASILVFPGVSSLLQYPTIVVALLLLALTLVRQMGIISTHARTELILEKTSAPLVISSTYAILYSALWIGSYAPSNTFLEPMTIGLVLTTILPPVGVAVYEVYFRDFMILVSIVSFNKYLELDDSNFRNRTLVTVQDWLSRSRLPRNEQPSAADRIREAETAGLDDVPLRKRINYKIAIALALIAFFSLLLLPTAFVPFVPAGLITTVKLVVACLLLGFSTNMIIIAVRFLYARFGRDDFEMSNWRYIRYSILIYALFGPQIFIEHGYDVPESLLLMLAGIITFGPTGMRFLLANRGPPDDLE